MKFRPAIKCVKYLFFLDVGTFIENNMKTGVPFLLVVGAKCVRVE